MADIDVVAAVRDHIRNEVNAELADRVFGSALPRSEAKNMPQQTVVIRAAGGLGTHGGGYQPNTDRRVDIHCYHVDDWDATLLANQIASLLYHTRDTDTAHGRIIWCNQGGGPTQEVTSEGWPFSVVSFQVFGNWLEPVTI